MKFNHILVICWGSQVGTWDPVWNGPKPSKVYCSFPIHFTFTLKLKQYCASQAWILNSKCTWVRLRVPRKRKRKRKELFPLRATSHMSQEPWPCNGEDPWHSSKGRTMGVGKAVICSHMPSSIVWSESGPYCGTIAYFVDRKRGEDLV